MSLKRSHSQCVPHIPEFGMRRVFILLRNFFSLLHPTLLLFFACICNSTVFALVFCCCPPFICRLVVPPDGQTHTLQVLSHGGWRARSPSTGLKFVFRVFSPMLIIHCLEERVSASAYVATECKVCFVGDEICSVPSNFILPNTLGYVFPLQ